MKPKSLDEWVEFYRLKTGEEPTMPKDCRLFYLPERGFASIKIVEKVQMVVIVTACGDGRFFRDLAELIANSLQYKCLLTKCIRHIKPYIRSFGLQIERAWKCFNNETKRIEDRYLCRDSLNRPVVITLACYDESDSKPEYWVTQYLTTTEAPNLELSPNAVELSTAEIERMESDAK